MHAIALATLCLERPAAAPPPPDARSIRVGLVSASKPSPAEQPRADAALGMSTIPPDAAAPAFDGAEFKSLDAGLAVPQSQASAAPSVSEPSPPGQPDADAAGKISNPPPDDPMPAFNAAEFTSLDAGLTVSHRQARAAPRVAKERPKGKKQQAPPRAIYRVLVDESGNIREVRLLRSSGVLSFDEAGKQMIYDGVAALPSWHETSVLTVALHFSRDAR
jgi:hypothetical protein